MPGTLVLGELAEGGLQSITGELLAAGRRLSESLDNEVTVALLGSDLNGLADDAISQGADKVYLIEHALLAEHQIDVHVAAFEQLCRQVEPSVVLVGKTPIGRDLGPRVAFRLGVGVAQDCVNVAVDSGSGRVVATRPVYGGNALATVTFPDADPQVVIVRAKVFEPLESDSSRTGEVIEIQPQLAPTDVKSRVIETVKRESSGVRLEDASVVIGGGRGLGGPDPFEMLEELAQLLGGAVGASRAVCDAGWLDHSYQVGLTGKTITPDLYITIGISGASQHMAGCSAAKHIVAINRDADANILKSSNFAVVGDWKNILPSFVETVRELVKS